MAEMLARDGHIADAERAARAIYDPSSIQRIGGTDYASHFIREQALYRVAAAAAEKGNRAAAQEISDKKLDYIPYRAGVRFALATAALKAGKKEDAMALYESGRILAPGFADAFGLPLQDPDGDAAELLVARATLEKSLGQQDHLSKTFSFARRAAALAENDTGRGRSASAVDRIAALANAGTTAPQSTEDLIKSLNIRDELNSTSAVAEVANTYLKAGDRDKARAVALYGFRNIDNYPQASGKTTVLLPYASIIARTEPAMSQATQKQIADIFRKPYPRIGQDKEKPAFEDIDLVEEGARAYAELKRRAKLDDAPPNEGDVLTTLKRDGSIRDGGGLLMTEWMANATRKYNAAHPEAPLPEPEERYGDPKYLGFKMITRSIQLPTHLYGGEFRDMLVVPADIPRPKGMRHGVTIFYMSDYTCEGNFAPFCKY